MTAWFADTSYFLGFLNPKDEAHQRATSLTNSTRMPLVTTTLVVVELANFLSHPRTRGVFATFLARFRADRRATIVSITDAFLDQAIALYAARPDKEWSLTDCASFVVMQHRGLTDALTADHHFDQADFVALLK